MKKDIYIAKHAGFCAGVKRAYILTQQALEQKNKVAMLGPLVHNPQVVQSLNNQGVCVIDTVENACNETVVIRSHGVGPLVYELAAKKNIKIIDATCPFVKNLQEKAKLLQNNDYQVFIVGERNHPEVKAVSKHLQDCVTIVANASEIEDFSHQLQKVGVVVQTTQSRDNLINVLNQLVPQAKEIRVFNTICTATQLRQESAKDLAGKVDIMLVIGGKNSGNTKRLYEICLKENINTFHIEHSGEIDFNWFNKSKKVGITAGASTPAWIIKEVVDQVSEEINGHIQETEKMEDMLKKYDETMREFSTGDIIKGTIIQINDDGVLVDVGYKSEGFIPNKELSVQPVQNVNELFNIGDEVEVLVLKKENKEGEVLLSKKRVDAQKIWDELEQAIEDGKIMSAHVLEVVKGGLVADIGVRGFIPASQISNYYVEDLGEYTDQKLPVKVLEVNRRRNKVILSHRVILEQELAEKKVKLWEEIEVGQKREGIVRNVTDFGAFIDIGGIEGLLHISEISWSHIKHPSEVINKGDKVEVVILEINKEKQKISLGLKQVKGDPWDNITVKYAVGEVAEGTITKILAFGAFVKLEDGVEGLVHISQLSPRRVAKVEDIVQIGENVRVKIIDINPEERKIALSMKEVILDEERSEYEAYLQKEEGLTAPASETAHDETVAVDDSEKETEEE